MSSNSATSSDSSASTNPDTGSAKPAGPVVFYVDNGPDNVETHSADKGKIFKGIYCGKVVDVEYCSQPTNRREDHSEYNTVVLLYDVCVEIHDPTNPSASFTADGTLHCMTYIYCEDEPIEEGVPNYYAWIKIRHPTTGKSLDIDYPRNIR
jgi:hypothetical protein